MMIRTKLKIVIYLCTTLAAISSITIIYSLRHMERKLEDRRDIHDVVRGVFDLNNLAGEYLLYHEERPLEQWNQKYNAMARVINIGSHEPPHRAYLVSLGDDYRHVKDLFSRLVSAYNNPPFKNNLELSRRLENHLESQILMKNHELVTRADRLEQIAERELVIGHKRICGLILGLILFVSASVIGLALLLRRDVVRPFENLIERVESMGEGNLSVRIETEARDEIGEFSRAFNRMVSRLKEAMVSRASLQDEVRHLDRAATMGTLTAAIAHEINQPLAAILSNAQAALRFLKDERDLGQVREALHDIVADDKRAGEVIRRLRMMFRKEEPKSEALDLNAVVKEIVNLIQSEVIIRNASIAMDLEARIPPVHGDRIQVQQVILNLLVNALDAVTGQPEETREVRISTRVGETDSIIVSVSDSGPGIEGHKLDAIFETFYTTKTKGMGMGLPISRSIIEQHNGRIWASNNPEGGATFAFTLPISKHGIL
ncbi:MAG: HAMP domain-containing protein [Deltaproteobacteria bacterium]|nr:HAMP domain-containing protein [Deltaproteobacteria bacterium]